MISHTDQMMLMLRHTLVERMKKTKEKAAHRVGSQITRDPANPQRQLRFVLEKKSKRQKSIQRRTTPKAGPTKTRTKKTAVFVSPMREGPKPIPIQTKKTEVDPPLELE